MSKKTMKNKFIFEYDNEKYYALDILQAIINAGVKKGDTIFVHSDLKSFGWINKEISKDEFIDSFIDSLRNAVGKKGNVIMPTFSYSFCKDEIFDLKKTPSTVGILTEHFRKIEGVLRSLDPIFSVAAFGPDKEYYVDVGNDCFGEKSIFEKLHTKNGKFLFLGDTFDITYMHFVEQNFKVPYRYIKKFKGNIKIGRDLKEFVFDYNVRPLDKNVNYDLWKIADYLNSCNVLKESDLGYSKIKMVTAVDAFNEITKGLKEDIYLLLKNNPNMS